MTYRKCLLFGLIIFTVAYKSSSELFTAVDEMSNLLHVEAAVVQKLKSYIINQEEKLINLKKHLIDYEKHYDIASQNISQYIANPMNAFLFAKRLTNDLKDLTDEIVEGTNSEMFQHLEDENGEPLTLPTVEDLNGAAMAINRIQDTYNLDVHDMANGKIKGRSESPVLNSADCFEIAFQSFNRTYYRMALPWFYLTVERIDDGFLKQEKATKKDILGLVAYSYSRLGNYTAALKATQDVLDIDPEDDMSQKNKVTLIETLKTKKDKQRKKYTKDDIIIDKKWMENYDSIQMDLYKKLCRKEIVQSPKQLAPLRCRYVSNTTPFLKIAPLKLEEASLEPYIVTFHDAMYDSEIEVVKRLSKPKLERAGVEGTNGTDDSSEMYVDYRISKVAWLADEEHKVIETITKRVQDMTGLTMTYAEELQVLNYGIGGHYEPHFDFALQDDMTYEDMGLGNRVATVLFYMSDVIEGGATVFPLADIAIWPQKGSAAFWFNLYKSGLGDLRTKHAGCPVLMGSKWACNKWLHLKDQEFTRPCGLHPDHPY